MDHHCFLARLEGRYAFDRAGKDEFIAVRQIWNALRNRKLCGAKFRRQAPAGPYIVDFLCEKLNLVVELDGDAPAPGAERKRRRKEDIEELGYSVLRFGSDIIVTEGSEIIERIAQEIDRLRMEKKN